MKLIKFVDPSRTYLSKSGETKQHTQLYLVLPLGDDKEKWIAIDPHFKQGGDYRTLAMFATIVVKDSNNPASK